MYHCPRHGSYSTYGNCPACMNAPPMTTTNGAGFFDGQPVFDGGNDALAAARDDVLRAALKDCETHPGDERLCNEDDVCLCDLCAAVDRWQKLEGSR